jgi:hypothetical protein
MLSGKPRVWRSGFGNATLRLGSSDTTEIERLALPSPITKTSRQSATTISFPVATSSRLYLQLADKQEEWFVPETEDETEAWPGRQMHYTLLQLLPTCLLKDTYSLFSFLGVLC